MEKYEVQYVTLSGGQSLPAYKMICPECKALVLETRVDTNSTPWRGHCPNGHSWRIESGAEA